MLYLRIKFKLWHIKNYLLSLFIKNTYYKIRKLKEDKIDPYNEKFKIIFFIFPYKTYNTFYKRITDINNIYLEDIDAIYDFSESLEHKDTLNNFFTHDNFEFINSKKEFINFLNLCLEVKFYKDCYNNKFKYYKNYRLRYITLLSSKIDSLIEDIFKYI